MLFSSLTGLTTRSNARASQQAQRIKSQRPQVSELLAEAVPQLGQSFRLRRGHAVYVLSKTYTPQDLSEKNRPLGFDNQIFMIEGHQDLRKLEVGKLYFRLYNSKRDEQNPGSI